MHDQAREVELHVAAAMRRPQHLIVDTDPHRQRKLAAIPHRAEFIRRHCQRGEGSGGLALHEAKALGQFLRNQIAQADIVDQGQQQDLVCGFVALNAHGGVIQDHCHFGLQIDTPVLGLAADVILRADEVVGVALVHQRVFAHFGGHLGAACLAHQFHMRQIGRGIQPLIGARQGGGELAEIGLEQARAGTGAKAGRGMVEFVRECLQQRGAIAPVVQCRLQGRGHIRGDACQLEIARNDA